MDPIVDKKTVSQDPKGDAKVTLGIALLLIAAIGAIVTIATDTWEPLAIAGGLDLVVALGGAHKISQMLPMEIELKDKPVHTAYKEITTD